ncbi:MAG TPA: ABC transporter permease [Bacillota bacterium]|nr:ABC transporter permease [Bacillota bacterium]HPE38820.1 ABC transporter permease [Bacillota bacterium]
MRFWDKIKRILMRAWSGICYTMHHFLLLLPFVLVVLSLVFSILSIVRINNVVDSQYRQNAADYFATGKDTPYRQITVLGQGQYQSDGSAPLYAGRGAGLSEAEIEEIRDSLNQTVSTTLLEKQSNSNATRNREQEESSARQWLDAYSSQGTFTLASETEDGSRFESKGAVVGVSGAYASFHPFEYLAGGFLVEDAVDSTNIVLNQKMAWNLFHSYNVTGREVLIYGTTFRVVGVVIEGSGKIDESVGVNDARAYIYFDELAKLSTGATTTGTDGEIDNPEDGSPLAVMCYEVLLPDVISGIAVNDLKQAMAFYEEGSTSIQIINNTGRFGLIRLWKEYFPLQDHPDNVAGLTIPTFELSARMAERFLLFWSAILILSLITLLGSLVSIYAYFHGKKSKHEKVKNEESEPEDYIDVRRV